MSASTCDFDNSAAWTIKDMQRALEKISVLERERDAATRTIEEMREAIREAHQAVKRLLDNGHHDDCAMLNWANKDCDCGHLRTETALAKLQPHLP